MKLLSKFFLAVLLLTVASVGWAACPEGTKNNYKGECVPTAESASTSSSKSLSPEVQATINALLEDSPYEELTNDVLNPDRGFYRDLGNANLEFNYYDKSQPYEPFVSAKEYIVKNPIGDIWQLTQTAPLRKE